jgi:hypothetical protein
MATYKVLQDIEAEDKLLGPLTLRQCIYAAIAVFAGWLAYLCISKGAPYISVIFLPFIGFGLFFAFPWSKQQSTEVWALAKIRFALKPRRRIWDQSGGKHLVTVTAPKHVEGPRVRDMSETEVRSRLQALADTIDSRGWAIKNVSVGVYQQPYQIGGDDSSDRLVDLSNMPQEVPTVTTTVSEDMFDLANNPIAQQFEQKISASSSAHRQQLVTALNDPASTAAPAATDQNYWFLPQTAAPTTPIVDTSTAAVMLPQAATPTPEEEALAQQIKHQQELYNSPNTASHLRTIQPLSVQAAQAANQPIAAAPTPLAEPAQDQQQPVTPTPNPAILELANNNDLNVATIAREAQHRNPDASNEVVVSLH